MSNPFPPPTFLPPSLSLLPSAYYNTSFVSPLFLKIRTFLIKSINQSINSSSNSSSSIIIIIKQV